MGLLNIFGSKKGKYKTVPGWAKILDLEEFNIFMELVEGYFKGKNVNIDVESGTITSKELFGEGSHLGLMNLTRQCKNHDRKVWAQGINGHFDDIIGGAKFRSEFDKKKRDFNAVSGYLALKLWSMRTMIEHDIDAVYREDIPGIATALAFDMPNEICSVSPIDATGWKVDKDVLFKKAMANIKKNYKFEVIKDTVRNVPLVIIGGDHDFVASAALDKELLRSGLGRYGALLSVPHKALVLMHPVNDRDSLKHLPEFIQITIYMNKENPGPISDYVYWYYKDKYTISQYNFKDGNFNLIPPKEFIEVLFPKDGK